MSDLNTYNISALSETAAIIDLGNTIHETLNNKVLAMHAWLRQHPFTGLKDIVPAYSSLTVLYDPFLVYERHSPRPTIFEFVKSKLKEAWDAAGAAPAIDAKAVSIPVCYDPQVGYDLKLVAAAKSMRVEEVIHIHCSVSYRVYMLGFLPGFPYMGKLDERLVMPRRTVPRTEVESGSVGIAGWQTGIYPLRSPGGWQVIGRTPVKLFDPMRNPPVALSPGDSVRFYPISFAEFQAYEFNHHVNNHH